MTDYWIQVANRASEGVQILGAVLSVLGFFLGVFGCLSLVDGDDRAPKRMLATGVLLFLLAGLCGIAYVFIPVTK